MSGAGPHAVVGLGTDVVDVGRFRRVLARTPTLAGRVFTEAERAYAEGRRDPTERLAVRFAAKEAVLKALGSGLGAAPLRDIEVVRDAAGRPGLELHDGAADLAARHGVTGWLVSLSHTELVAQATVIAVRTTSV